VYSNRARYWISFCFAATAMFTFNLPHAEGLTLFFSPLCIVNALIPEDKKV